MGIGLKTHKLLWGGSGSLCALCKRKVFEDETLTDDPSVVGEEAHIVSKKKDGPRFADPLPMARRDLSENLVILCNTCHKVVDDQFRHYTVELLRKMKQDHEAWVLETLGVGDDRKRRDDLTYAGYVDDWAAQADLASWLDWSYGMLSNGRPRMRADRAERLEQLKTWILGRVWPGRYPELEAAFHNFRRVLEDLLNTFHLGAEAVGDGKLLSTTNTRPKSGSNRRSSRPAWLATKSTSIW
jgi:DNA-directed RNA polymerase subunit N (RpoN/RPB10)